MFKFRKSLLAEEALRTQTVLKYAMSLFTPTSKHTMIRDSFVFLTQNGPLKEISELKLKFSLVLFFFFLILGMGHMGGSVVK